MASKNFYGKSFVTPEFRLSFPHLFAVDPYTDKPGKTPKYNATLVMSPEAMKEIRVQLKAAAEGKWGPDRAKWPTSIRKIDLAAFCSANAKDGWPIRDGDDTETDGYAGLQYVKASTTRAPGVVGTDRKPILSADEAHAGVICRARLQAFAFEGTESSGVALSLEHILVVKDDGTNWGGGSRVKAEDAFDEFCNDGSEDAGNYAKTGTDDGADL